MMSSTRFSVARRAAAAAILAAILISCQSIRLDDVGLQVPAPSRILLEDSGTRQAVWQADELSVNYTYHRDGTRLDISGKIDFSDALKYNFSAMSRFDLWIHFVDAEGKIIASRSLFAMPPFHMIEETPFERRLKLPPNAGAFVFSYSGYARDGGGGSKSGDDGAIDWDFWKRPDD